MKREPHPRWTDSAVSFFAPGEVLPSMSRQELLAVGWTDSGLQAAADDLGIRGEPRLSDQITDASASREMQERRRELFDLVIARAMGTVADGRVDEQPDEEPGSTARPEGSDAKTQGRDR